MVIAGKYNILKDLGEGGYGRVYLVQHTDLGVKYALKLLTRSLSEDARFIERFKREAEILIRFTHPGSVQLRDFGRTDEGLYYMAMDFCDGEILQQRIARTGRFPLHQALELMDQILDVLAAAHHSGIIHRDIKPDNVMLVDAGAGNVTVKILDFGIAKLREQVLMDSKSLEGVSIGTPQYMSPEQASGEINLDHRADIYSAGVLFYELLTGEVPFKGTTVVQTLLMHLTKPLQKMSASLGIPENVEAIVRRSMAKEKGERYSSADEFKAAIAEASKKMKHSAQKATIVSGKPVPLTEVVDDVPEAKGSTVKILCLDDNEMILNILKHILEKEGYEVFTATDCSAIHGYLFSHNVELLISDVQMPGLPGTRVCKMLKESLKSLKIVLFSNLPDRELEKLSKESQADDWISKNARPEEWIAKVREILAAH